MRGPARYLPFARNVFSQRLAYRANFFFFIAGNLVESAVLFFLWKAIFSGSGGADLNGFSFPEMVVYLLMTVANNSVIAGRATNVIHEEIRDGSIAFSMIRPINFTLRVLFDSLGDSLFRLVFVSLPAVAISVGVCAAYGSLSIISLRGILLFIPSLILAYAVMFFYKYLFGLSTIIFYNLWGLSQVSSVLISTLSGSLIPLAFFPLWARPVLEYLPFASMVHAPVMAFLGKLEGAYLLKTLIVQASWALVLGLLAALAWRGLVKRLTVQGG